MDYNQIAKTFHARYASGGLEGIGTALVELVRKASAKKVLEVGCGTGHWIEWLRNNTHAEIFGLDASTGMLGQAAQRIGSPGLIAANANRLPVREEAFDVVFCVNAFHHFDDPSDFLAQAPKLLVSGGTLAIVGIDPRTSRRYQYEYFEGALDLDLSRYPSFGQIVDRMGQVGLGNVEMRVVDAYDVSFIGEEIYRDPFLEKPSNSLMALLTDEAYAKGLKNIAEAIAADPLVRLRSKIDFTMITGVQ